MEITYIGHSGFLVELETAVLLFDYFQGEIPEVSGNLEKSTKAEKLVKSKEPEQLNNPEKSNNQESLKNLGESQAKSTEKKWYVFASHRHQDHFQPEIFNLAEKYPDVQYILSSDIWKKRVPEARQAQTVWLKAGENWEDQENDLRVETLKSTDEGVAFVVRAEGQVIYHAGDLNHWHWDLEPEEWNRKMEKDYRKFTEPLRGRTIDAAFVVLDPRQGGSYALGMDYFLELTEAKKIYPMHCWEDYSIIDRWMNDHQDNPYLDRMVKITKRGEHFSQ